MKKIICIPLALGLLIAIYSCNNKKSRFFTEEQVASLELDSTSLLSVRDSGCIYVELASVLKPNIVDFTSVVDSVSLIPLQTTEESLVDDIYKVLVTKDYIYIMDKYMGGGLIIFKSNGTFVRRLGYGRGPGELNRLYDFAFDTERNRLVAFKHSYLMFFSSDGEFLEEVSIPFMCYNINVVGNEYVFKTLDGQGNEHMEAFSNFTFLVADEHLRLKSAGLPRESSGGALQAYTYLIGDGRAVAITESLGDTIFQYSPSNGLQAKFILDYHSKKLPERYYVNATTEKFNEGAFNHDYYFYIGEYLESEKNNFFLLRNYKTGHVFVYRDKRTGNLFAGSVADYKQALPPISIPKSVYDGKFVSVFLPSQNDSVLQKSRLISKKDKERIKALEDDANPVLVLFSLKDF